MIFYYDGFLLDLITKEWTPSKDTNINSIKNVQKNTEYKKIFKSYSFQKKYIESNPELIKNIPINLLNDKLKHEYEHILNSNIYNL